MNTIKKIGTVLILALLVGIFAALPAGVAMAGGQMVESGGYLHMPGARLTGGSTSVNALEIANQGRIGWSSHPQVEIRPYDAITALVGPNIATGGRIYSYGNAPANASFLSNASSGNFAFQATNVGARLSLGNSSAYIDYDATQGYRVYGAGTTNARTMSIYNIGGGDGGLNLYPVGGGVFRLLDRTGEYAGIYSENRGIRIESNGNAYQPLNPVAVTILNNSPVTRTVLAIAGSASQTGNLTEWYAAHSGVTLTGRLLAVRTDGTTQYTGVATAALIACDASMEGGLQYDTTTNTFKFCDGAGSWTAFSTGTATSYYTWSGYADLDDKEIAFASNVIDGDGHRAQRLTYTVGQTGVGTGNVVLELWNGNSSAQVCALTISCTAAAGSMNYTSTCTSTTFNDQSLMQLRWASTSNDADCTTFPRVNATVAVRK